MMKRIPILGGLLLVQRLAVVIARETVSEFLRLVAQLLRTLLRVRGWLGARMFV